MPQELGTLETGTVRSVRHIKEIHITTTWDESDPSNPRTRAVSTFVFERLYLNEDNIQVLPSTPDGAVSLTHEEATLHPEFGLVYAGLSAVGHRVKTQQESAGVTPAE